MFRSALGRWTGSLVPVRVAHDPHRNAKAPNQVHHLRGAPRPVDAR